jgi:aerobic-type carbon monoxide dehydrogenase small subunit (CoxS/CutS family)
VPSARGRLWPSGRFIATFGRPDSRRSTGIRPFIPHVEDHDMIEFKLNAKTVSVDAAPDTPLLWVLRDSLHMNGTKFGCGAGFCGACTVHIDGAAQKSCQFPVGSVAGKAITTIEGLSADGTHPVQKAWIEEQVPQCGYCQSGQIMRAASLLAGKPKPTDADIDEAMSENLCRCGTYQRIRRAIHRAAGEVAS